jgi:hypothetical protein
MTTGWGIDPLKSGSTVTAGTTAADFRQIQGGLYSPGLISGGKITRSASALSYTVSAGVAAFPIVTGTAPQTVLGPIPAQTVNTTAPSSGTRTDIIYAQQRIVSVEGDPQIVLGVGTSLPARAVMLDSYIVSSTNTNTNAAVKTGNIVYSIPYGASLGRLVNITSMFNTNFNITAASTLGSGTFFLPTDRLVQLSLTVSVSANLAVGFDNTKYCEAGYDVFFDNVKMYSWSTMGLHQAWQEINWNDYIQFTAGSHTIRVEQYRAQGPGTPRGRAVSSTSPYARISIVDVGPVA